MNIDNKSESASNSQQPELTEQERERLWQKAMENNPAVPYYDIWRLPDTINQTKGI